MSVKKTDKRVLHTKKFIREALLEMMKTKMIHQISVLQLCKEADINRNTFYAHYSTPEDVLKEIEDEIVSEFQKLSDLDDPGMLKTIEYIKSIRNEYMILLSNNSSSLAAQLNEISVKNYERHYREKGFDLSQNSDFAFHYIAGGNYYIWKEWVENGFRESPEEISRLMEKYEKAILAAIESI